MSRIKFDKETLTKIIEELKDCQDKEVIAKKTDIVLERYNELVLDEEVKDLILQILAMRDDDPRALGMVIYLIEEDD